MINQSEISVIQMEELKIQPEHLERVADLYDTIRELHSEVDPESEPVLQAALESRIREAMTDLSNRLSMDLPTYLLEVHVLATRHQLLSLCSDKITDYFDIVQPDAAKILREVFNDLAFIFKEVAQKLLHGREEISKNLEEINVQKQETEAVLKAAEDLESQVQNLTKENEDLRKLVSSFEMDKDDQLEQLQQENRKYLEKIIKLSKQLSTQTEPPPQPSPQKQTRKPMTMLKPQSLKPAQMRDLTLKQTKDFIEEVYNSKTQFDKRCIELGQPRETMLQHMHKHLNKKYGLKSLRSEWTNAITKAIDKHSEADSDVALFGKIIKSQVEEDFRFVQAQVKNAIQELLRAYLRQVYPYMREVDIKALLNEKMAGELEEPEWRYILNSMYSPDDAEQLANAFNEVLQEKVPNKPLSRRGNRETRNVQLLTYHEFLKSLLDFQLDSHETSLALIREAFESIDTDENGIIDEHELREFCDKLGIIEEYEKLLEAVDPYEAGVVNFSDLVGVMSEEQEGGSLLQYLNRGDQ